MNKQKLGADAELLNAMRASTGNWNEVNYDDIFCRFDKCCGLRDRRTHSWMAMLRYTPTMDILDMAYPLVSPRYCDKC